MDKYWSDSIQLRTAQDMLTWRRHAEDFANHGTLRLPNYVYDDGDDGDDALPS